MKNLICSTFIFLILLGCSSSNSSNVMKFSKEENDKPILNDTIKIENDALEYEVIIIDAGFSSWFNSYAKPRSYYSQQYLEARNRDWVLGWNNKFYQGNKLFDMSIDYQSNIDYGYEVNYLIYNYLTYFQLTNKIKLGGFVPRI